MMIFSSVIAPGTVILVMAAGTTYAMYTTQNYDSNGTYVTFLVIYILTAVGYAAVCLWCSPKVQLKTAKVLTFVFAIIMAVVSVGVAVQISRGTGGDESIPVTSSPNTTLPAKPSRSVSLGDIAVSTWYLAGLASLFIMAALLHPSELYCLFHAPWYLLFLPSGYLFLIIYSICNLHSRSWGTREEAKQNTTNQNVWQALKSFFDVRDICSRCTCCFRSEPESPQSQADSTSSKDIEETNKPTPHTTDQSDSGGIQHSTLSPCDGPCAMSVEGGLGGNAPLPSGRCVRNSLPIKDFLDNVGLTDDSYVQKFRKSGYDDTSFFIKMKTNDIEALGVKSMGSVNRIMKAIDKLPDMCMTIQPGVPENVAVWLESLGLSEYRDSFAKAGYEGKDGVSCLVSVDSEVLRQEIGVSKPGHWKKLQMAIKMIKHPTDREVAILKAKVTITELPHQVLGNDERKPEHDFWSELKNTCLEPDSEEFNEVEDLKQKLTELRNHTVVVFTLTNIIWIVLITLLAQHANLTVLQTNALGLAFLVVYGLIVVVQFLTLIWHRLITILHYLAHPVRDTTQIIPLSFEHDVDFLDDVSEVRNRFSSEIPANSGDENLMTSPAQHENKRLRRGFQGVFSSLKTSQSEETQHLLSTSNGEKYTC